MSRLAAGIFALVVLIAVSSSMPACGDNAAELEQPDGHMDGMPDGDPPCDAPVAWTFETLSVALHAADCSAITRCDPLSKFQTQEECIAHFDGKEDGARTKYLRGLREAIDHRTAVLDQAGVERCLAELRSGTCPASLDSPACKGMLVGTRAAGASCFSDEECVTGSCNGLDIEQACGAGTCASEAAIGQACTAQLPCAAGAHCVPNGGGSICEPGEAGSRCAAHPDCDDELFCKDGTCTADLAIGVRCSADEECGGGSQCIGDLFGLSSAVCGRVTAVGDACDDYCFGAVYCRRRLAANGTCQALPTLGQTCSVSSGRCAGVDLYCSSDDDTCAVLPALGETCFAFCTAGLFCSNEISGDSEGICVARGAADAECVRDGNCASYNCNDSGKCVDWAACRGVAVDPPLPAAPCP